MKILLAPSETKSLGGSAEFKVKDLFLQPLLSARKQVVGEYERIIEQNDFKTLSKMFGVKKEGDVNTYAKTVLNKPVKKAIQRYTGVAFDYLDYNGLNKQQQGYVDKNVILFSNLFGPVLASDLIPEYKLKQGEQVGHIKPEKLYNENSKKLLDEFFRDEEVLDLRAGFYDKFYKPEKEYTTMKFVKDGKVVSHWAKAYRGLVLKEVAKSNIKTIEELKELKIKGLKLKEETRTKNKIELVYDIVN